MCDLGFRNFDFGFIIIFTDASCVLHLQGYIDKNNLPLKTIHLADVLASRWGNV